MTTEDIQWRPHQMARVVLFFSNQQYMIMCPFQTHRKSPIFKTISQIAQGKAILDTHTKESFTTMQKLNSREDLEDQKLLLQHILAN